MFPLEEFHGLHDELKIISNRVNPCKAFPLKKRDHCEKKTYREYFGE